MTSLRSKTGDRPALLAPPCLSAATVAWQLAPGQSTLTVIAKLSCAIAPDGTLSLADSADDLSGDRFVGDEVKASACYPSDMVPHKERCDVLVVGCAYPPKKGMAESSVRLRMGDINKQVAVFGARKWVELGAKLVTGKQQAFEKIPMLYEHAVGGAGFDENPVGRSGRDQHLPHFENPKALIAAPGDRPKPCCLAPISPFWPSRWNKLGSYGNNYLNERWPYFAADFQPAFFQGAPPDQQLKSVQAKERFSISGMRPEGQTLNGQLLGHTVRAWAKPAKGAARKGQTLQPIELKLDTVVFDTEAMQVHLVWRGLHPVSRRHAPEVDAIVLALQADDEAALAGEDLQVHWQQLAQKDGLLPVEAPANDTAIANQARRQELLTAGMPAAWLNEDLEPTPTVPGPGEVAQLLGKLSLDPQQSAVAARLQSRAEQARDLRADVERRLAAGEGLAGLDLRHADLSGLDLSGQSLEGSLLKKANLEACNLGGCNLRQAQLQGAFARGAIFAAADLSEAHLAGADISQANFEEARLDHADLSRVQGSKARFHRAVGEQPNLSRSTLTEASFRESQLDRANFFGAELDGARFDKAQAPKISLVEARGKGCNFQSASMPGARCMDAELGQSNFLGIEAPRSNWDGSDLEGADFSAARLERATFSCCRGQRSRFRGADLSRVQFRGADLRQADLQGAHLLRASFASSDLRQANLRGANLFAVETLEARFEGAQLKDAQIAACRLPTT
jgi:uncharacterized protein YjbI with pentapeptide repeats